jgi:hypothetical protein
MPPIPPSLIGTVAPILDGHYTHAELDALFMQSGFPGDPPQGNKTHKCLQWMRRANTELPDGLRTFGVLIAGPAQPVDATQALNLSAGVSNCKVSRGRSLS